MKYIMNYQKLIRKLFFNNRNILPCAVLLKMLFTIYESYQKVQTQERLIAKQLSIQKCEYEKLMENIKKTARQRHDLRHHLLTIRGLIQTKNYKALENYFNDYIVMHSFEDISPICSNVIVDTILRHFISKARTANIEITTDIDIPNDLAISDLDLCVVFGNLVENAFEACVIQKSDPRFIKIKATTIGEQLLLIIQNSFILPPKQINGVFYSSKRGGKGIGISSAKSSVEHGGGNLIVDICNNIFTVEVLMNFQYKHRN